MNQDKLQTPYGVFSGTTSIEYYPEGAVKGIRLNEKNVILTHAGDLVPFYGDDSPRRKYKSTVSFHQNGMLKAVSLEEQQELVTPIGELPAELVTFYDSGELKRIFPLDGKISGFWSEDDERELNIPLSFDFDFTAFTALISGLCFYKSGDIRSVTLFPGEYIKIKLRSYGTIDVRHGFSLYESGKLQSIEPAVPRKIATAIGVLTAYDQSAIGVNADRCSLSFDEEGRIISLVTSSDRLFVHRKEDGADFSFSPKETCVADDEDAAETIPLMIQFNHIKKTVMITDTEGTVTSFMVDDDFVIMPGSIDSSSCSPNDCASCSLCGNK